MFDASLFSSLPTVSVPAIGVEHRAVRRSHNRRRDDEGLVEERLQDRRARAGEYRVPGRIGRMRRTPLRIRHGQQVGAVLVVDRRQHRRIENLVMDRITLTHRLHVVNQAAERFGAETPVHGPFLIPAGLQGAARRVHDQIDELAAAEGGLSGLIEARL